MGSELSSVRLTCAGDVEDRHTHLFDVAGVEEVLHDDEVLLEGPTRRAAPLNAEQPHDLRQRRRNLCEKNMSKN